MHVLQPQLQATTLLRVSPHSTAASVSIRDQVEHLSWQSQTTESEQVDWLILHFNA